MLISSPRLIADCYVLLRLQMPRHPPFALKDLKSHELIYRSFVVVKQPPKGSSLRCSRPLCSSQSTVGTPRPLPPRETTKGPEVPSNQTAGPVPQDPTACRHRHPSPRRSHSKLRTNQRSSLDAMSNVPPMSSQRRTDAFELGSGPHVIQRTTRVRCSLERR